MIGNMKLSLCESTAMHNYCDIFNTLYIEMRGERSSIYFI